MKNRIIVLLFFFSQLLFSQVARHNFQGIVVDSASNIPLYGCNLFSETEGIGTSTDSLGRFTLSFLSNSIKLKCSYIGYESKFITLSANSTNRNKIIIKMSPIPLPQKEVLIMGKRNDDIVLQEIRREELQRIPNMYGDVIKSVQILSGVASNNEFSSAYNVRGGSYDENLVYLNGFEIYRPFLLKQGIEENQSLVNQDMADDIKFHNGVFSPKFGDKLSSALEINYKRDFSSILQGTIRADLFNAGLTFYQKIGNLSYISGMRIAYPSLFLNRLHLKGEYKPSFSDVQLNMRYDFSPLNKLEIIYIYADNKFENSPDEWIGHFMSDRGTGLVNGLLIDYDGYRKYNYNTNLLGLSYKGVFNKNYFYSISGSSYLTSENEDMNTTGSFYFIPDASYPDLDLEYIKTRKEVTEDRLKLFSNEIKGEIGYRNESWTMEGGFSFKSSFVENHLNEFFSETGDSLITEIPIVKYSDKEMVFNSYSSYIDASYSFNNTLSLQAGFKVLNYEYNKELLFSPRISISYIPFEYHSFSLAYGHFYQPPFYYELKYDTFDEGTILKSQNSVQVNLNWDYRFKDKVALKAGVYYKDLDNIIPYYIDNQKTIYMHGNVNEGYAYGLDFMFQGEITKGLNSRLGYSYLDTKERPKAGGGYTRRLTDQTHTIQVFLQDKISKHPNWQSHLRFLFGSGFLYYYPTVQTNNETGQREMKIELSNPREYLIYLRVDMGLSANFNVGAGKIIAVAEVLNMFDQKNIANYNFVQVFKDFKYPIQIPTVLSSRFFNIRCEYYF